MISICNCLTVYYIYIYVIRDLNLVDCQCGNESSKLVLGQRCGTAWLYDDFCDVNLTGNIQEHAPISLQDLQKMA